MSHPGSTSSPHPRADRRVRALAILLVGVFLVASLPVHLIPLRAGNDPSFWYGLNLLADSDYRHGRDVVFPYGPLGYLLVPLDVHHNLLLGLAAWLLLHALLGGLLFRRSLMPQGLWPVATFAGLFLTGLALGLPFQYRVVLLIGLLMSESLDARRGSSVPAAAAGVLTALGLLSKFGLGIVGVSMLLVGETVRLARRGAARTTAVTLGAFLVTLTMLVFTEFGGVATFRLWLRNSLELASDYGIAMSLPAYGLGLLAGVACLALFGGVLVVQARKRLPALPCALIYSLPVLFAFKHGFARQDGHIQNFFSFTVVVLAALALRARTKKGMATLAGLVAVVTKLIGVIGRYHLGLQTACAVERPPIEPDHLFQRHFVRGGLETKQIAKQEALRISHAAVGIGDPLENLVRGTHLRPIIRCRDPQPQNVRAQRLVDLLRFDDVAQRFGHLVTAFVHGKSVCQDTLVWSAVIDADGS